MKIVTNSKLIKRNAAIGKCTSIGALVVLGIGLYITFKMPDKFAYSMGCLLAGFMMSQVGIYFGNRWGRSPRPDEIINKNLKGMGREYTVYHYVTQASHLLIGPAGAWNLLPLHQGGKITYDGKRWRTKGGGFARSYLRIFGQENIGRPDQEAEAEKKAVVNQLVRILPEGMESPEVRSALLFTDPKVELDVENAPLPAMTPKDLKEFLKKQAKEKPMPALLLDALRKTLPQPEREED
jgi:hypothetical protein